ncbi:hypothetical protein B0H66DRAFT_596456 [Apodospora peruviana]|uniref:HNH nuclease domain-containing protein n=1 Tax=Apodospora peruviana TaxID=516989 RepID=A0AAE0IPM9_9PEZI|nr:hypothetical protein B0H66DRAFT_596456 [Apodospora peruviana]
MSSAAAGSGAPQIPQRTSSKRGGEDLERAYKRSKRKVTKKMMSFNPTTAQDAHYWSADALHYKGVVTEAGDKKWKAKEEGSDATSGRQAKRHAAAFSSRSQRLLPSAWFQVAFTKSQIGICASKDLFGRPSRSEQSKFRKNLIQSYRAAKTAHGNSTVAIYDTATGQYHMEEELNTANNGLLLHTKVKNALDDGAIAIVPDLPDDEADSIEAWSMSTPKTYRWKVTDRDARSLDESINPDPTQCPPSTNDDQRIG